MSGRAFDVAKFIHEVLDHLNQFATRYVLVLLTPGSAHVDRILPLAPTPIVIDAHDAGMTARSLRLPAWRLTA